MRTRLSPALALLIALPPVAVTAWALVIAVGERTGSAPFAAPPFRNSAEAAAAGDAAAALRFIRLGDNPTRVHAVRPEIISSAILRVTTLEAALWSRRINMIRALDREGAIVGDDERQTLACLALDLDQPDVAEYLAPGTTCVRNAAMERVVARSRDVH